MEAATGVSYKIAFLKNFAIFTGKTPTQVFFCEYCGIFKNTYFEEHLPTADSECMKLIYGTTSYLLKMLQSCILDLH